MVIHMHFSNYEKYLYKSFLYLLNFQCTTVFNVQHPPPPLKEQAIRPCIERKTKASAAIQLLPIAAAVDVM